MTQVKAQHGLVLLTLLASFLPFPPPPPNHWVPTTLTSKLFPKHAKPPSTSGPLHFLCPQPECFSPDAQVWLSLFLFLITEMPTFTFYFWLHPMVCEVLVPWPGIKPRPPALGVQSLSDWTTREVPWLSYLIHISVQMSLPWRGIPHHSTLTAPSCTSITPPPTQPIPSHILFH